MKKICFIFTIRRGAIEEYKFSKKKIGPEKKRDSLRKNVDITESRKE